MVALELRGTGMGVNRERRSGGGRVPCPRCAGWSGEGRSSGGGGMVRWWGTDGSMMPAVLDDSKRQSVSGPLEAALLTFYLIEHRSPQPWVTRFVIA